MSEQTPQTTIGEVRVVALSRISPGEDFNPRGERDPERFAHCTLDVVAALRRKKPPVGGGFRASEETLSQNLMMAPVIRMSRSSSGRES